MNSNLIDRRWRDVPPGAPAGALPEDLRICVGEDRLVRLVLETVAESVAQPRPRRDFVHAGRSYPVAVMLTLVTFCYASARFGSQEIEESLRSDPTLRYLCAGDEPSSTAVRRFRRVYRGPLSVTLLRVFLAALRRREMEDRPDRGERDDSEALTTDLAVSAGQAAEAAIGKAVLTDAAALDY